MWSVCFTRIRSSGSKALIVPEKFPVPRMSVLTPSCPPSHVSVYATCVLQLALYLLAYRCRNQTPPPTSHPLIDTKLWYCSATRRRRDKYQGPLACTVQAKNIGTFFGRFLIVIVKHPVKRMELMRRIKNMHWLTKRMRLITQALSH